MKRSNKHQNFMDSLKQTDRMLIMLRDELYDGNWNYMQKDLEDRLTSKPYIFKLVERIQADLDGIKLLRSYEKEHKINLKDYT